MAATTEEQQYHGRPWWRWIIWIIAGILLLPVMAVLLLQLAPVQDYLRRQGELYLERKLHTKVRIGYLRARGWQYLELRHVSVTDTASQALLYSGSLKVRYNLLSLINNELRINKLEWDSVLANVYRRPQDSTFNYQFIIDAFVSKKTEPDTLSAETGTTLQFHIKDLDLRQVRLRYIDGLTGMSAVVRFDSLHVDPDDILLNEGVYAFRGLALSGLKGFFKQEYLPDRITKAEPPPPPADTSSTPFHLLLKKLRISNSSFLYTDAGSGIYTAWQIGALQLDNSNIDQDSTRVQIGELKLDNTRGVFALNAGKDTTTAPVDTSAAPNTWQVLASKVALNNLAVRFDNNSSNSPRAPHHDPDYNHLLLTGFTANIADLRYKPDSTSAQLKQLTLKDHSGFAVKTFRTNLLYTPQTVSLQQLLLETNKSILRKNIAVTVPSWSTIADHLDLLQINANLDSSRIALGEWLPFVPDARKNKNFAPLWNKQLAINAILKGSLGKLIIEELYLRDNEGNLIQTKGEVAHVTNMDLLQANIPALYIQTGNRAIRSWLPHGTLPDTPRLPERMSITGSFLGSMKDMQTSIQLKSNIATANLTAHLQNITDSIRATYDVSMPFFRIHPGVMLYDTAIGWVSGHLSAKGQGYVLKSMVANASARLNEATYNGYTYHDVSVDGNIDHRRFQVNGQSGDTAITANFDIAGVLADTTLRELVAHLQIEKADLYATHWYAAPFVLKADLNADFPSIEPRNIQGQALITGIQVATKGQVFPLDTVSLDAKRDSLQYISLKGPFGFLNASGDIDYTKVGDAFSKLIMRPIQPPDTARIVKIPSGQLLAWNAAISWPRSLQDLLPGLRMETPLVMEGRLNSDSALLWINASLPKVRYDSLLIDSLQLKASIEDSLLQADISIARLQHPLAPLHHTELKANAVAGKLDWDLLLEDNKHAPKYQVGGLLSFLPANVMELSIKPDLLLNRLKWNVGEHNIVRLRDGLPDSAHLKLSYKEQSIALVTQSDSTTFPAVNAQIKDFQLSTITGLLAADTLLATGILNGEATARNLDKSPLIAANIQLDSLTFRGSKLGILKADVQTPQPNQYKLAANLSGNDNNINIEGTYDSTINANVDIAKLNMASLEAFTFGQVTQMQGSMDGQFTVAGTPSKPQVNGKLHFNDAGGNIAYIGSTLRLPDETLLFDQKGITLNKLVIADSLNNELVVNGQIQTNDFSNFQFLLDVNAEDFMALGEQKSQDQWIYGPAFIDAKAKIRGTLDLPRVDVSVTLRDKSKVTVSMPSSDPGVSEREGVIVFVDKDNPIDSSLITNQDTTRFQNPRLKGIIFSGNAEITPASTIKMIIDPQNGDFVEAKGTANINATLDPSSKMSLTGRYELQEGKYEMSLNQLIKRSFDIVKGSVITFNGDAMDADLDITAKYTANAQAMDLVADQLGNMNETDRNKYKQRLPFEVYLMIKGNLAKPDISFRLDMPERERNAFGGSVYNRLKQINQVTSELNKQVMGLLVLGSFIPDDPMAALSGGGGVEQAARQSVSKILSQQLNNLAGNLIKGVDINFDLQSRQDYSTGSAQESTNLNVGVSKRLFNDRLTVSVGSNIMLQGQAQQNTSSLVGDISAEYQLTADGRYRVRIYQRNATETIVQGQVVETGVAFMIVMDYDEFREIFRRSRKDKEIADDLQKEKKKSKKKKR
ncbi:translocation/assembly module TamB [Chitinophaga pendula]|uniref:translocation/assembly module TamB domain-containing protein n=1 Tax=Chitinophaga TaxID=79328 RepID=UPI000BAF59CE|nr:MULTISPECIES: translocation/assembly module TamB domain-containing protein [Chitinophaga]ASZ10339.1 hypothetical protein CK934_04750 [Chitinophaga sp. MD30]UCJ06699.1 translocation/assembly module TamB [Chitinophaga pendula]